MKLFPKLSLTVALAAVLALSGAVYAFAGWIVDTPPTVIKMRVAAMPPGNAPSVAKAPSGKHADLRWVPTRLVPGVKAQSYIVTRIGLGAPVVVCDHVTKAACRDKKVPPGTWTWKVRPVFESWEGEDSPASLPLEFAGRKQPAAEPAAAAEPGAADVEASATGKPAEAHADPAAPAFTAPTAESATETPDPETETPPVTSPPTTIPADPPPTSGADNPAAD